MRSGAGPSSKPQVPCPPFPRSAPTPTTDTNNRNNSTNRAGGGPGTWPDDPNAEACFNDWTADRPVQSLAMANGAGAPDFRHGRMTRSGGCREMVEIHKFN